MVRGPSYAPAPLPVALKVETPDRPPSESDDADENRDTANLAPPRQTNKSSVLSTRASGKISTRRAKAKAKAKKRSLPRKSKVKNRSRPPSKPTAPLSADESTSSARVSQPERRRPDPSPVRTYSSSDAETDEPRRTPPALLAPIRVPRMSDVFEDNGDPRFIHSPAVSNDSWALNDCAERFDDIEDDLSSGIVKLASVGKHKVVHKAALAQQRSHEFSDLDDDHHDDTLGGGASVTTARGTRGKRKSKPFLESGNTLDTFDDLAPPLAPDSAYDHHDSANSLPPVTLSRQISAGVLSDEIQFIDTSGDDVYHVPPPLDLDSRRRQAAADMLQIPSPLASSTAGPSQRGQHDDLLQLPQAGVGGVGVPPSIMRRTSSTANKRKTVSFHDESPVVIEPNLRAPRSLPRESMLTKSSSEASEYKDALDGRADSFSGLRGVRDSVSLAAHTKPPNKMFASIKPRKSASAAASQPPKTLDIPRPRNQRELSDSSEEPFQARSSRRMSRVSVHDKSAIRAASKRQSRAVAQAMSEQIRGVPKSAMLAFSENEVLISDDALDEEDSDLSFRRSARMKSIRMPPTVVPGQVPPPPPPPPFQPETQRVRSVRRPPPPPVSPIRR